MSPFEEPIPMKKVRQFKDFTFGSGCTVWLTAYERPESKVTMEKSLWSSLKGHVLFVPTSIPVKDYKLKSEYTFLLRRRYPK